MHIHYWIRTSHICKKKYQTIFFFSMCYMILRHHLTCHGKCQCLPFNSDFQCEVLITFIVKFPRNQQQSLKIINQPSISVKTRCLQHTMCKGAVVDITGRLQGDFFQPRPSSHATKHKNHPPLLETIPYVLYVCQF